MDEFGLVNGYHLLRRPEELPSLDKFWVPPPTFQQLSPKKPQYAYESGLNSSWTVDVS